MRQDLSGVNREHAMTLTKIVSGGQTGVDRGALMRRSQRDFRAVDGALGIGRRKTGSFPSSIRSSRFHAVVIGSGR